MARTARSDVFDPHQVSVFHCINRCVRRGFLCGVDPLTGNNYEHRKDWIEQRLAFLAEHYAIDVLGFCVLDNHFHVILRNRPDIVSQWSDEEVARRWLMLCPVRKQADGSPETPNQAELDSIANDAERLAKIRTRLSDISWFMRMVSERIARRANNEENISGRFWQGRFRGVKICDDAALLACVIYVDLNPIRANLAETPEASDHTSAQRRIEQQSDENSHAADWLAPLSLDETALPGPCPSSIPSRCSDKGFLPMSLEDYLMLLDWTGRQIVSGKSGHVPDHLAPLLVRLGIDTREWIRLSSRFGELFYRVAGSSATLHDEAARNHRHWYQAPGKCLLTAAA